MKVLTVLGTRPEIIRLSVVIRKLDEVCEHILVHTGQNYDRNLNEIFFEQLNVRPPDYYLGAKGKLGEQIGTILSGVEEIIESHKPDKFLVLGDTNSALSAIVAKRTGIPVYHMEAGNRCYDDRVPEEVNRRIIDHSSDILMPYTERSRQNLVAEGIPAARTYVTGNPILEVISGFEQEIAESQILKELSIQKSRYFLVTLHRAENVDIESRLISLTNAFKKLRDKYSLPVIISTHPRTASKMEKFGIYSREDGIQYLPPFGFFDFVHLEQNARLVLSDSGTVQEECCIFKVPNVTLRDVTERPETIECGSNILSGAVESGIIRCADVVLSGAHDWSPPAEYLEKSVAEKVIKIIAGFHFK